MTTPTTYSEEMQRREAWLERRAAKRREWAEKAEARSETAYSKAHGALAGIEPGQPILLGHHSQRKHENAIRRHNRNMSKSVEESRLAGHHERKADGCERALANRHRPDFCVRRIKEADSAIRHLHRNKHHHLDQEYWQNLVTAAEDKRAYWTARLEELKPEGFGAPSGATHCQWRNREWFPIVRINRSTITVKEWLGIPSMRYKLPIEEITGWKTPD